MKFSSNLIPAQSATRGSTTTVAAAPSRNSKGPHISYQGIQRLETFLFPFAALREALLNAVVHKDYSSGIPIQISVYAHRIVIWNPGQLPQDWTLERLMGKHPSRPFNPLIANAFFRAGYIESWGRGIEKIRRECRAHGIAAPLYDYGMSGLMLTFKANPKHLVLAQSEASLPDSKKGGEKGGENLTQNQKQILALLRRNSHVSARELAGQIGINSRKVEQNIAKLKGAGWLRRTGPAKGGYWDVLK